MSLSPDEIEAAYLPRARVGGYKARPTAALLHRVSWDYRQIVHQHGAVAEEVEQLRGASPSSSRSSRRRSKRLASDATLTS